jgi:hypothetical protein
MSCGLRNFGKPDDDDLAPSFDRMLPDSRDTELRVLRERVATLEAEAVSEPGSLLEKVARYREEREHYKESWLGEKRHADTAETKLEIAVKAFETTRDQFPRMNVAHTFAVEALAAIAAVKP